MIPWLLVVELLGRSGHSLSQLVDKMLADYPSPGEINRQIANPSEAIERVRNHYQGLAHVLDQTDGLSMEFAEWRFNLRSSNTEPVVRLNIETRGNTALMAQQRDAILKLLEAA
jgi:phosphomannomutase